MLIGEKIKIIRGMNGLSQHDMAKSLKVSSQAVSNWERGKDYPDILNVIRISDLYRISLDELIREDKNYKEVLLKKKFSKTADNLLNVILLLVAVISLIYSYTTNSDNHFLVILTFVTVIHIFICVCKKINLKICKKM
ncbi:helix-turn-helix transcriptional regulator [Leuconostoc koreense]|nr:helix-turn-helix transcriptional regulator [Leuconostoc mesenteroides]QGM24877.1 helix-turn-helix domain-containing protein [Leuconostoc mesenteroides subsp. mesenteroides]